MKKNGNTGRVKCANMNTSSYISLLCRRWKETFAIMLLTATASFFFGLYFNKTSTSATIFINIGAKNVSLGENAEIDMYENVQAADQFTETVQGWFKNPTLTSRIEEQSNTKVAFTARKQEKQNLIVTYKAENEQIGGKIAESLQSTLQQEITEYNEGTNSNFQIALYSIDIKNQNISSVLFAFLGAIIGLFLGIFVSYGYEYFFGFASYDHQIETILDKKQLDKLSMRKMNDKNVAFLGTFIERMGDKNIVLAGVNFAPIKLLNVLKEKHRHKALSSLDFPVESAKLSHTETVFVVCRLGKTKLDDLKKIVTLLPKDFHLVIVQ